MTRSKLIEKLRKDPENRDIAAATVTKIEALMDRYATPDAFFALGKGELQKRWHEMGNQRDLGAAFFEAFDRALAVWKTPETPPAPRQAVSAAQAVPAAPTIPATVRFKREELLRIADAMELLGADEISVEQMMVMLKIRSNNSAKGEDQGGNCVVRSGNQPAGE